VTILAAVPFTVNTLMSNRCWCLHSIISAAFYRLNVCVHMYFLVLALGPSAQSISLFLITFCIPDDGPKWPKHVVEFTCNHGLSSDSINNL
jgi:hypothetical protein